MTKTCLNCKKRIVFDILFNLWYHKGTEAARCHDDASFTYAEPIGE